MALEHIEHLVAIRTDAVILREEADVSDFIDKDAPGIPSGTWRKLLLTNVNTPHKGDLISDQKIKLQGVEKKLRVNKSIDELRREYG